MKMTFRWYGSKIDPIPLKYVKQIPGMTGLMGLLDKPAGVLAGRRICSPEKGSQRSWDGN